MAFNLSLLEILILAEHGRQGNRKAGSLAEEAAKKLIVPLDSGLPSDFVLENYYDMSVIGYNKAGMPMPPGYPIFDVFSHFFQHNDRRRYGADFDEIYKIVVFNQPDDNITSIVIGRLPVWRRKGNVSILKFGGGEMEYDAKTADSLVYLYIESGASRTPLFSLPIRGNVPLAEGKPLLYFSFPYPENAPIIKKHGLLEEIGLLVPKGYLPRQYREAVQAFTV